MTALRQLALGLVLSVSSFAGSASAYTPNPEHVGGIRVPPVVRPIPPIRLCRPHYETKIQHIGYRRYLVTYYVSITCKRTIVRVRPLFYPYPWRGTAS
jgi:hypothetical protein